MLSGNKPTLHTHAQNLTDEQKVCLGTSGRNNRKPIFEAESPDELALVDTAFNYNLRLKDRTPSRVVVDVMDEGKKVRHILRSDHSYYL